VDRDKNKQLEVLLKINDQNSNRKSLIKSLNSKHFRMFVVNKVLSFYK
jgi:hypothetical protein